jgi:hypothetical protein
MQTNSCSDLPWAGHESQIGRELDCKVVDVKYSTLHTAEILSGKNAQTRVSIVSYLKKQIKIEILKWKKNPGSRLDVAC